MKVLHVITNLQTGGAEKLVVDILPILRDMGNDVQLMVLDGRRTSFYEQLEKSGVPIHASSVSKNVYNPLHLLSIYSVIKHFDIIHAHNTSPQFFCAFLSIFLRKKVFCTTEHSTSNRRRSIKWMKSLDKWMYNRYNSIICISNKAEQNLREYLNRSDNRILTIYNGINLNCYSATKEINQIHKTHNSIIITMVGRLARPKDQDTIIRALPLLTSKYELWLVGDGPRKSELQNLSKSLHVENRVSFLGFRLDIPQLLRSSDIIVMSSYYEGMSLASIEGMAAGKPVIASDVDGLREVIMGAGIIFPSENYCALAEKIKALMSNTNYYALVSEACLNAARNYDIVKTANAYNCLYNKLLKN